MISLPEANQCRNQQHRELGPKLSLETLAVQKRQKVLIPIKSQALRHCSKEIGTGEMLLKIKNGGKTPPKSNLKT